MSGSPFDDALAALETVGGMNAVLRELEPMLRRLIGEQIELVLVLAPNMRSVYADASQLQQVVMNLVVNARDAMPHGGRLIIETADVDLDASYEESHFEAARGPHALIAVSDTGHGMDQATRERVFEPFFTTKNPGQGTGLGLSTVFGIVKQSGGNVYVSSEPGAGTTFKVYLPVTMRASTAVEPRPTPRRATGTETILLVDDEAHLRRAAHTILTANGYKVLAASDPLDALALVGGNPGTIHVLLTDVVMRGMNGKELAKRLVAQRPELRVIYISGYAAKALVNHGVLDDGVLVLPKPLTTAALLAAVRDALDH